MISTAEDEAPGGPGGPGGPASPFGPGGPARPGSPFATSGSFPQATRMTATTIRVRYNCTPFRCVRPGPSGHLQESCHPGLTLSVGSLRIKPQLRDRVGGFSDWNRTLLGRRHHRHAATGLGRRRRCNFRSRIYDARTVCSPCASSWLGAKAKRSQAKPSVAKRTADAASEARR
jgi:hypothetical protein